MMFQSTKSKTIATAAGILALVLLCVPAFAEPQVNVKAGKFESAKEKNAVKALTMKENGFKGDAASRELGNKLFREAKKNESVALKDDGNDGLVFVSKSDPSAHFRIDKNTGDISFHKGFKEFGNDGETANLPAKDKAAAVAKKHLADLGLLPANDSELVVKHIGGLKQVDVKDGKPGEEHDKLVTVHFGRQIDGVNVGGPGSKIVVDLGANGDLVSVQKRWIEVTEEKRPDTDAKGQSEVVTEVKNKVRGEANKAKRADTTAPDFGYFDDGKGHIEPAYFFNADLVYDSVDAEGKPAQHKEKYHGAVPALKGSKADFKQLEKAGKQPGKSIKHDTDRSPRKD